MKSKSIAIGLVAALALMIAAVAAAERIKGTPGPDQLSGTAAADAIWALAGDDTVNGGDGNDRLHGGKGNDTVDGGAGNDRLFVGPGADTENGGDGNDRLHLLAPDGQADKADCGAGDDVIWVNAAETSDTYVNCETVKTVTVTGKPGPGRAKPRRGR